jgi:hypothetical protein
MRLSDLLVASIPFVVLLFCIAWTGIPALIEWRRERKYQAEWYGTFGKSGGTQVARSLRRNDA